jgi:hypothetical protein
MSAIERLIVVDDNWRFAVHVFRYLTGAMEFSFPASPPETYERVSPDGRLEVHWHNPRKEGTVEFRERCRRHSLSGGADRRAATSAIEVWCAIDVRFVPGREGEDWSAYRREFVGLFGETNARRAWMVSSYGYRGAEPAVRPKTVETLRALAHAMRLDATLPVPPDIMVEEGTAVRVLVTGAGFELKESKREGSIGVSIGCPPTKELVEGMRPEGKPLPKLEPAAPCELLLPLPYEAKGLEAAAKRGDLDDYWDALISHFPTLEGDPAVREVAWREAFRRAFLVHDFGHQTQSLIAARMGWDYWLTTNYTRFADRAIEMASDRPGRRPWRAITTPIEADAVAPFAGPTDDLAKGARIIVKLHGDIGHAWTMAVAGRDKRPDSTLAVRPQLHRMYAVAQTMLLGSLWRRQSPRCLWHIVGHGLQDKSLVHLMAAVIERSPVDTKHEIVYAKPRREEDPPFGVDDLVACFTDASEERVAETLRKTDGSRRVSVEVVARTALQHMSRIARDRFEDTPADRPRTQRPPPREKFIRERPGNDVGKKNASSVPPASRQSKRRTTKPPTTKRRRA